MSEADDKTLIGKVKDNGDEEAFKILVKRHKKTLYNLCYRYLGNHQDSDEVSQRAFIKAYENLHSFREESSFKSWICRIAINTALNHLRKNKPKTGIDPLEESSEEFNPGKNELHKRVGKAVRELPPKQRETVILRAYEEMKYREIAEIMNCSEGTAKANYHHGIQALKAKLKDIDKPEEHKL